jgi:heat shock protein HslJ
VFLVVDLKDMKNSKVILTALLVIALTGVYSCSRNKEQGDGTPNVENSSPENATFFIDGQRYTLVDGLAELEVAPGSASKNLVSMFDEPQFGDMNRDGDDDALVILALTTGGSATFYYAAIAANVDGKYIGSDAILLGDRIDLQAHYVQNERGVVNYAVRNPGESFDIQPSLEKTLHLQLDEENLRLIQVELDFEGEANPNVMTLNMKTWTWIKTQYNNDTEVMPHKAEAFTLIFNADGKVSATTDCNSMNGSYEVDGSKISFSPMVSTRMYCENSQENVFGKLLQEEISSFLFTAKGELVFVLKFDSGTAIFK